MILKLLFVLCTQIYHICEGWTEFKSWAGIKKPGVYHRRRIFETWSIYLGWLFANMIFDRFGESFPALLLGCILLGHSLYEATFTIAHGGYKNLWNKPYEYKLNLKWWTLVINTKGYSHWIYITLFCAGIFFIIRGF